MSNHNSISTPPEIRSLLQQLRRRIRRYVFLEGTALVIALLGFLFWFSFGIDFLYFKLSNLELPRWFRMAFDVMVVCLFTLSLMTWVALRLIRSMRTKALALVLERRFPELDDRLITAVELAESSTGTETPLTISMLNRTIDDVARDAQSLDLGNVFEKNPLRRSVLLAALLVASIGGFALANQQAISRWKNGYINLDDVYWSREYGLTVKVIAQPGDTIKPFKDQQYKHPRGNDLTLLIEAPEGKKVPNNVSLKYEFADGRGTGDVLCSHESGRTFKHSFSGLLDDVEFWVVGGDYTNRRPYRVVVVDPPRVDNITLDSFYPEYTAMKKTDDITGKVVRDPVAVLGTQISLPAETDFLLQANCNKTLVGIRIQYDPYELSFRFDSTTGSKNRAVRGMLTIKTEEGKAEQSIEISPEVARTFFDDKRTSFTVPFVLSEQSSDEAITRANSIVTPFGKPFIIHPDSLVRIYLEDTDDIIGSDPARLTINGIVDQPPIVETSLKGVGIAITRKALVPLTGTITDDYGIATARFEFKIDNEEQWQRRPFTNPPLDVPKLHAIQLSEEQPFERFEVLPLALQIGQKLTLSAIASDSDNLNGPHHTRSESYAFRIVSNEELLSLLYEKELNMRKRFERIISEVQETQKDLILHRTRVEEKRTLVETGPKPDAEEQHRQRLEQIDIAVAASAERALHAISKNANETAAIEESFRDIREELVNNAVDTPQLLERIDNRVVLPLHAINVRDYPAVDDEIWAFKRANEKGTDPTANIDASVNAISAMLARMNQILLEMRKLETFQEALELLKAIIGDEEKLSKKTNAERKKALIKKLREKGLAD